MSNLIPYRIQEFLLKYPPFYLLDSDLLNRMVLKTRILYRSVEEVVYDIGNPVQPYLYVVREGAVAIYEQAGGQEYVVDMCGEGDIFGLDSIFDSFAYSQWARIQEEALLYAIPVKVEGFNWTEVPEVNRFFQRFTALKSPGSSAELAASQFFPVNPVRELVCGGQRITIGEAAHIMAQEDIGSLLVVDDEGLPIGIVTDKDFRKKVLSGEYVFSACVTQIMSSPVVTSVSGSSWMAIQLLMLQHRIRHICVTADGTAGSRALGMISMYDLVMVQTGSPGILLREISRAETAVQLRYLCDRVYNTLPMYLAQNSGLEPLLQIFTELFDGVTQRALELSLLELDAAGFPRPKSKFCWLALGSAGRGEQALRTDQDNALIFECTALEERDWVPAYFLQLAKKTNEKLEACGFEYCPAGMMAGNPEYCLPLDRWKDRFRTWIGHPTPESILQCTIFFDFRAVFGEKALAESLRAYIVQAATGQSLFWSMLAKDSLNNPPPMTFFRNLILESSGAHQTEFDIKARGLMPFVDMARLLALHAGIVHSSNTMHRFTLLQEVEPTHKALFGMAVSAYLDLLRLRLEQGTRHHDGGRYCTISEMTKLDQAHLRSTFIPLRELQDLIRVRFQTAILGG